MAKINDDKELETLWGAPDLCKQVVDAGDEEAPPQLQHKILRIPSFGEKSRPSSRRSSFQPLVRGVLVGSAIAACAFFVVRRDLRVESGLVAGVSVEEDVNSWPLEDFAPFDDLGFL